MPHVRCGNCSHSFELNYANCCPQCRILVWLPKEESVRAQIEELEKYSQGELMSANEKVDHPSHYNQGKFEVIDVIEDWKLNFHLGNAVKYIARADHKNNRIEDLKKAIWYLQRALGENKK